MAKLLRTQTLAPDPSNKPPSDGQVPDHLAAAIANRRQSLEQAPDALTPASELLSQSVPDYNALLISSERRLATNPQDADAWYQQGDALANLGHHQAALQSFQRTLELLPHRSDAWVFQAVMLIQLKRYQEALESTEQAIALQPDDKEAWTFKGVALRYLGRYREAYASYDQALGVERLSPWQNLLQISKGLLQRLGR